MKMMQMLYMLNQLQKILNLRIQMQFAIHPTFNKAKVEIYNLFDTRSIG